MSTGTLLVLVAVAALALAGKPRLEEDDDVGMLNLMQHPSWRLLPAEHCGMGNQGRIIGGINAELGAFPWIARLGYANVEMQEPLEMEFRCGGSLINERYVLTAAHCVVEVTHPVVLKMVRLGDLDTKTNPDCDKNTGVCAPPVQDIDIEEFFSYTGYGVPAARSDIALLRLQHRAFLNEFVEPICLPFGDMLRQNFTGQLASVAGWGVTNVDYMRLAKVLQVVDLPILPLEMCTKDAYMDRELDQTQICAGGQVGRDSCGGDSGGPLMKIEAVSNMPPRYFLLGVVSFGPNSCGASNTPAVYSRVTSYLPWILDRMRP